MKIIKNVLVGLFIVCGIVLWLTRSEDYQSQSAFANADNVIWYHAMHMSGIVLYCLLGYTQKRWVDYVVAGGLAGILATNMYVVPMLHNGVTAFTLFLAVGSMIYFSSSRTLKYNLVMAPLPFLFFGLGLFDQIHLFTGEVLAEIVLGAHLLRRINIKEDA